jgi:hypothetical protein
MAERLLACICGNLDNRPSQVFDCAFFDARKADR